MKGRNKFKNSANVGVQIVLIGALTGVTAGLMVTLYNLVAHMAEEFSRGYYTFFRENPAFIPLLFAALFLGSIVVGGFLRFLPMVRGSGVPQVEGAARGSVPLKWFRTLTGTFAASLFTIFMGLAAGSEGPSLIIGGSCGCGVSEALKRNAMIKRYQITGGACAGLAVAFNAPFTGMAFAFEEAHKRFTPEVFVCAFSSVVFAVLTRNLLYFGLGMEIGATFRTFALYALNLTDGASDFLFYAYVLLAAFLCSLAGVGCYYLVFLSKKIFKKITFWKGMGKYMIPFLFAGVAGLVATGAMGGGAHFISSLGSGSESFERVFSSPIWVTLLVVVILRIVAVSANMGAGVPCGVFVPMLAIGAGMGALLSIVCGYMGMDPAYADALILICMATFFTTIVRAPITGTVMVVELTFGFTYLLPVILGVAVGYLVGDLFRLEPLYDRLLDEDIAERESEELTAVGVRLRVEEGSTAAGRSVRDVLWPAGARIILIEHEGKTHAPDGNSSMHVGDILTVTGTTRDTKDFIETLSVIVGEIVEEENKAEEKEEG